MNSHNRQDMASRQTSSIRNFLTNGGGFVLTTLVIMLVLLFGTVFLKSRESAADPSSFSQTDLGDGWTRYESSESPRFAVSLPSNGQLSAVNIDQLQSNASQISNDSVVADMLKSENGRQLIKCCLKLAASDSQSSANFNARVVVLAYPEQAGTTLESLLRDNETNARQSGVLISSSHISSKAGDAGLLKLETSMKLPSGKTTKVSATEYLFLKDQDGLSMTLGSLSEYAAGYAPIFDRIGQSFEWL